jgi:hypothetical protein
MRYCIQDLQCNTNMTKKLCTFPKKWYGHYITKGHVFPTQAMKAYDLGGGGSGGTAPIKINHGTGWRQVISLFTAWE